jgi:CO dehydrogenase maturation factor
MKIAVAGKGGSGKTTIAGTLARVLAIDGDTSPNLANSIGIPRDEMPALVPLPNSILQRGTDAQGKPKGVLTLSLEEVKRQFGTAVAPHLILLEMARVDHAGAG